MSRLTRPSRAALTLLCGLVPLGGLWPCGSLAAEPPLSALTVTGPERVIFSATRDACDGADVPDAPIRAFRDATGGLAVFGLHYRNRALRGPDLDHLKIDCRVVLDSGGKSDPALYDDRSWITATWTEDGTRVAALVHHEFQANEHEGRCRSKVYMECWYNTSHRRRSETAARSRPVEPARGGGRGTVPAGGGPGPSPGLLQPLQHRRRRALALLPGLDHRLGPARQRPARRGVPVPLGRSRRSGRWRAWTGTGFTAAFPDPYRKAPKLADSCRPVGPFPGPVGALVRQRGTGAWIAVFMAAKGGTFAESGFTGRPRATS